MDPISAPCRRDYTAVKTSGTRNVKNVRWIVMHDEEASTAASAASWFENRNAGGSAHLCVDDKVCYRTLPNDTVAWGAPGANEEGFHIEQAGFARWSAVIWKSHLLTLRRAAYKAALHCHVFGLPPVFVTAPGLKAGKKGVTTHAECTKAFGGDHTDPGAFWPRLLFMGLVRRYYAQLSDSNL
jgi:hypothetical protein